MRLVLLALLVVTVGAELRQKRTLGIIFRGLVDAQTRQLANQAKKEPTKVEKLKSAPPNTVYLIPVPERDKKSEVQTFNTPLTFPDKIITRPLSYKDSQVKAPAEVAKKNVSETKQFLIRIMNDEGKSIMLRVTGDDILVKKKGDGYMIGVSHNNAKANINIELPDKRAVTKSEMVQSNLVETFPPFYSKSPTSSEKYNPPEKGAGHTEKTPPVYPLPQIPAYPYPVFFPPHYFQPLPYESRLHTNHAVQYPSAIERPYEPRKPPKESELEGFKNTTSEGTTPSKLHLTVKLKSESAMKETVAEKGKATTEKSKLMTQVSGYHYPSPEPRYVTPVHYPEPNPPKYQWYLQPPQQAPQQQIEQPRDVPQDAGNWNYAHYTPYPSYLQDTLAPPYLPTGYGRATREASCCSVF